VESLSGIYVVVVDAEKDRRAVLTSILRYCGALVTPVETPDNAFAVMEIIKPDAVVLQLAALDDASADMIHRLRSEEASGGSIAAVAVGATGLGDVARHCGFDAYIEKPFDPWELCRVVSELVTT